MTLIELLIFIANVGLVLGLAGYGYKRAGLIGLVCGVIGGFAIIAVVWCLLYLVALAANRLYRDQETTKENQKANGQ